MSATIELRCPTSYRQLFAKVISEGGTVHVADGNLMEFACPACKRMLRQQGTVVTHVLHRYNLVGELIETEVVGQQSETSATDY